jgi:tetratricopeptide (TPR) repeat protein
MMRRVTLHLRAALLAAVCVAGSQLVHAAEAAPAEAHAGACTEEKQAPGEMSEATYGVIQNAMELLSKQKYDEAIAKLSKIADSGSSYEKAVVNYNLGFAYSAKNDHAGTARAFAKALSFNALPRSQREQLQYNTGQLYIVLGQSEEGISMLQAYITSSCSPVPPEAHIFLANALAERKRFQEALPQIDQAIAAARGPKESWLQLRLAIAYELKDYGACAQALEQLISLAPAKAEYWKQLSGILYEMKADAQSTAVMALADRQGFLQKPAEIHNLYSIYMQIDMPFQAGTLVQDAIDRGRMPPDEKNLESVADAWINARESAKAETTLKKLASISDRGEYYFKLGAMYGDDERWQESKDTLQKALQKGGLKREGEAWMRLAVAQYSLKDTSGAIAALRKAVTFDETRTQAGEWLRHLSGAPPASGS